MPVFSRKQLRRTLARQFIYDLEGRLDATGQNLGTISVNLPVQVMNIIFSNTAASGQDLYERNWLFFEASTNIADSSDNWYQYAIASYNAGSGAFISGNVAQDWHTGINYFEVHGRVPPLAKNNALDDTLQRIRIRQEVAINTVDGALVYTIDGAASPNYLEHILDVHLMANPNNSLDLDLRHMQDWQVVTTATGRELRLKWGVKGSQQIVFDAILIPSLGAGENATINLPDERWILAGAAMRCYDFMIQSAPGQQVSQLMQRRAEWAAEYTRLSAKFMPTYEEPIRLHDVVRGMTPRPWDSASNFW